MAKQTTQQQLDEIRSKLLQPANLWAKVEQQFLAGDTNRGAVSRQVSGGKPPTTEWGLIGETQRVMARTKSEARALLKGIYGKLPVHSIVYDTSRS